MSKAPWFTRGSCACAALLVLCARAEPASARSNGIAAYGCSGCHQGDGAQVTLTAGGVLEPGEETIFTVRVTRPNIDSAGVYIPQPRVGSLRALSGEGLVLVPSGLSHATPRAASDAAVTFRFGWTPPSTPDGATLEVYAVAANGNGAASGDAPAGLVEDLVFGCEPQLFYRDADGDGFGWDTDTILRCAGAPPSGYATVGGDCDDFRPEVHPGAEEICNQRDDNCNGEVDEDAVPVELWPDGDGDGYYATKEGEPRLGCVPMAGYAAEPGDCDDTDPNVHPDAEEICNYIDDNCNGRIDERVRPRCGIGFCERESYSCQPEDCFPGEPSAERCSGLDENCNGLIDEGLLCDARETCISGQCLTNEQAGLDEPPPGASEGRQEPAGGAGCTWGAGGSAGAGLLLAAVGLLRWRRRR